MIVGVVTTCHAQCTSDRIMYVIALMDLELYVPPFPASIPELKVRIRTAIETITADMLQTVWNDLDYHVDVFVESQWVHI